MTWRGLMFSGVPNLAWVFGCIRTSWTMRADLVSAFVCRQLEALVRTPARFVVPDLASAPAEMPRRPFIDPEDFSAGYVLRSLHLMPRQGDRAPWLHTQDYYSDAETLPAADLHDGSLRWG